MPRFDVALHIEVEAEDAGAAIEEVRANYSVVNDPHHRIGFELTSFVVDGDVYEIDEDEEEIVIN